MDTDSRFWDKVADKYAQRPISDKVAYEEKLKLTQRYFTPESRILEFGCGTGSTALIHALHVKHITAVDYAPRMIEIAEQKLAKEKLDNVTFRCSGLSDPAFQAGNFDAVLGLNVLHLIEDYQSSIGRAYELLKPGGVFVTSTGCIAGKPLYRLLISILHLIGKAPKVVYLHREKLKQDMIDAGFTIVERLDQNDALFLVARK